MLFLLLLSLYASTPIVQGAETHDVAVVSVAKNKVLIPPAMRVKINVTVENQGTTAESFNVTVYRTNIDTSQNTTVGSMSVELEAGQNETLAFLWEIPPPEWPIIIFSAPFWDTDPMEANCTIWAEASVVDGEVDTSDNICVDGTIHVILRFGDVDGNGVINIFDIVILASRYGLDWDDPGYNPLLDYGQDGVINIFDIVRGASAYGTQYF
jgi:hypothetical protein